MKQIYDFELNSPPVLNENMLRSEQEKRRLRWQTAVIALAGLLLQTVIVLIGLLIMADYPVITMFCLGYTVISFTGSGVLAVVATRKGGNSLCE